MRTYVAAESIKLIHSGNNYFETLEQIIDECNETLHLQTYIFQTDATGMSIVNAIGRAKKRGVKIFILLDAFGSAYFSKDTERHLTGMGVEFRFFSPFFSSESVFFGRRLHHKIIVADQKTALIGGINIADKYHVTSKSVYPWLDYAVMIKGSVCEYLHLLCEGLFFKKGYGNLRKWEKTNKVRNPQGDCLIRFRRNDFIKGKNEIHKSYMDALSGAKESITIVASYFLPGFNFRRMLRKAAAKGIKVNIVVAGKSDITSVRWAESYLYAFYLRNKINIYEWTNSVMHGKVMLIDDKWITVGSYNLNYLSHYISIELNADIICKDMADEFGRHFKTITSNDCVIIEPQKFNAEYGLSWRFKIWLAYVFHKLVMNTVMLGKRFRK